MNEKFMENKMKKMPDDILNELGKKVDILTFKFKKIEYLEKNIKERIQKMNERGGVGEIHEKILFDFESYLITSRSIIDILMHCINVGCRLKIGEREVHLGSIYHHPNLDKNIKNTLHRYSHNKNSDIWNFIYENRNKIIHQESINSIIPYEVNFISSDVVNFNIYWNKKKYRLEQILYQGNRFLENFTYNLFEIISVVSNNN